MSDQMAAGHKRDYDAHRLFDDAQRALREVLASPDAKRRLSGDGYGTLMDAQRTLERAAAHIVAVWD